MHGIKKHKIYGSNVGRELSENIKFNTNHIRNSLKKQLNFLIQ